MPTHDFGTVTLAVDDGRVDAFFPFEHSEVKDVVKAFKGRWNPERRCWIVTPRFAKASEDEIVSAVREALLEAAPKKWPSIVEKFGKFACATKRYEVVFGVGGIRLTFPAGHPCHYYLEKVEGAKRQGETWLLPAKLAKSGQVMPIVQRAVQEDEKKFVESYEPYVGRVLTGTLPLSVEAADEAGIRQGRVVFADFHFVKEVDPVVVNLPVQAWPFTVLSREDQPGEGWEELEEGVSVRLAFLEASHAVKAVRRLRGMPEADRPIILDKQHAVGKWKARRG